MTPEVSGNTVFQELRPGAAGFKTGDDFVVEKVGAGGGGYRRTTPSRKKKKVMHSCIVARETHPRPSMWPFSSSMSPLDLSLSPRHSQAALYVVRGTYVFVPSFE